MSAGYYPVGAVAVRAKIAEAIAAGSGIFGSGHTYAGSPVAAAVTGRVLDYLKEHNLIERCVEMGEYLASKLEAWRAHPTVGDIRGVGLLRGVEFVQDKETKQTLDPELHFSQQVQDEALARGVHIEASFGCDRGQGGDMILFGPPFIITRPQIDEMVAVLDEALATVEKRNGF